MDLIFILNYVLKYQYQLVFEQQTLRFLQNIMSSSQINTQLIGPSPSQVSNPTQKIPTKLYFTPEMTPINRYNIVVDCYNMPCNIIDGIQLEKIPQSNVYDFGFQASTHLRGKILFVILCVIPFLNIFGVIFAGLFAIKYWISLRIHQRNLIKTPDPFKKMTFNPEMCFNMGCDYYFFTIQLKELEPQVFITNYQQNMNNRLRLRKQRGKTNIMIYNASFWASYNYFEKWKVYHYSPFAFSIITATIFNAICIVLILN